MTPFLAFDHLTEQFYEVRPILVIAIDVPPLVTVGGDVIATPSRNRPTKPGCQWHNVYCLDVTAFFALTKVLGQETTMTLAWIAQPLQMGAKTYLSHLLYWQGKEKKMKRCPTARY